MGSHEAHCFYMIRSNGADALVAIGWSHVNLIMISCAYTSMPTACRRWPSGLNVARVLILRDMELGQSG